MLPDLTWPIGYDFFYLWSAGHIAAMGGNPYDPVLLRQELLALGWPATEGVQGLTHLPYMFWLYYLFSLMSFSVARGVWISTIALGYLGIAAALCRKSVFPFISEKSVACAKVFFLVLVFPALWADILFGQVNILALLGLLALLSDQRTRSPLLSGLVFSLTAVKPHLFLPVYAAVLIFCVRQKELRFLFAAAGGLVLQVVVTWLRVPQVFSYYAQQVSSISSEASVILGASIGQFAAIKLSLPAIRVVLPIIGCGVGAWWGMRMRRVDASFVKIIAPLSLVTAPYVWMHSFVILIPSFLAVMSPYLARFGFRLGALIGVVSALGIGTIFRADLAVWWSLFPIAVLIIGIIQNERKKELG